MQDVSTDSQQHPSPKPQLPSPTDSTTQLKATLLRTTLAKQNLEAEKAEMLQRLEDLKRSVEGLERQRAAEEVLHRHQRREAMGHNANEVRAKFHTFLLFLGERHWHLTV